MNARLASRAGMVLLAWVGGVASARAQPDFPRLSGPVIDQADMLTTGEEGRLSARLSEMFATGGPQMQVWTFPSLRGDDIAPVGIRAADAWKLGRAGKDDGVILLIAERERRTRLEVGRGLEGVLPDILAGRLLADVLRPALRAGRAYDGILGVVAAVERAARGEALPLPPAATSGGGGDGQGPLSRLLPGLVPFLFLFLFVSGLAGRRRRRRGVIPILFPGIGGGGWGGGGWRGGGGGGGWSGGGGGFGGGGASGDW